MKILNIESKGYSDRARSALMDIAEYIEASPIDGKELQGLLGGVNVLMTRLKLRIDSEIINAGKNIRAIASTTTGLDHIDLKECESRGIRVIALTGEVELLRSVPATAELTWGLILSLTRKLPWAFSSTKSGEWTRDLFKGRDLANKTIGILGMGRIGEKIARYAQAFGMKVQAYDPFRNGWVGGVKRCENLGALLKSSDVLSLHVPLTSETEGMLSLGQIAQLPKGALLINTSRGKIVNEQAVLMALEENHLGGAALDVLSDELLQEREMFDKLRSYAVRNDNLILIPHMGGVSSESMQATEYFIAEKIQTFVSGQKLLSLPIG